MLVCVTILLARVAIVEMQNFVFITLVHNLVVPLHLKGQFSSGTEFEIIY